MPPVDISPIEAFWIGVNGFACLFTTLALIDAWADRQAIRALNGRAREIAANGNVRRELLRLVVQNILLLLVVPGIFSDQQVPLNFFVVMLIAIPVVLLISTVADLRDRKRLLAIISSDLDQERRKAMQRIEQQNEKIAAALQTNTEITERIEASLPTDRHTHDAAGQGR